MLISVPNRIISGLFTEYRLEDSNSVYLKSPISNFDVQPMMRTGDFALKTANNKEDLILGQLER
jgi:hypothetical protein